MYKFSVLLALLTTTTIVKAKCSKEAATNEFSEATYEFASNLMKRYSDVSENHFVLSPLSLWAILSVISEGAAGRTLRELKRVLKHHKDKCISSHFYDILRNTSVSQEDVVLERCGLLVIDQEFTVLPEYIKKIEEIGTYEVLKKLQSNVKLSAEIINNRISEATKGFINEAVTSNNIIDKELIAIDTLYFNGKWKIPFNESHTKLSPFYDDNGNDVGSVDQMCVTNMFKIAPIKGLGSVCVKLPYGNTNISMLIFLPNNGAKLSGLVNNLKNVPIHSILRQLNKNVPQRVKVMLPKFKVTTELDKLTEILKNMGIVHMFSASASLSKLTDKLNVCVEDVIQKAAIEVNEIGTEASAVSAVSLESKMFPRQFNANKPFLFMIVDTKTKVILFCGAYSDPTYRKFYG